MASSKLIKLIMTALRKPKVIYMKRFFLEEKLDFVTENFCEYEKELLSIASRMMVFHNMDFALNGSEGELKPGIFVGRIARMPGICIPFAPRMIFIHTIETGVGITQQGLWM